MKKTLLASTLATLLLAGCGGETSSTTEAAKVEAPAKGKAELGTFGVDLTARNLNVKPGDDFFMYASGTWYDNYVMPADKTRFGAFSALAERSEKQVKEIIDDLSSRSDLNAEEQLVADFYNAYMDVETINKLGLAPIQSTLDQIAAVKNTDDLTTLFGNAWLNGCEQPNWRRHVV